MSHLCCVPGVSLSGAPVSAPDTIADVTAVKRDVL